MTPSLIERLDQPSHTSGPWSAEPVASWNIKTNARAIIDKDRFPVAWSPAWDKADADSVAAPEEAEANARLIAAAPGLLKALTHCQRVLADLVGGDKTLSTINIYAHAVEAELKARTALAAAKGSAQP